MKVVVAALRDFPDGERRIVEVRGGSVGVFRVGDNFYALRNVCPHQGGPLCIGAVAPQAVSSVPGQVDVNTELLLLACPWHGWEYDLATGQSFLGPGNPRARRYSTSVRRGEELADEADLDTSHAVQSRASARNHHPASPNSPAATLMRTAEGLIRGPYVAETIDVRVEEDYVVIDA